MTDDGNPGAGTAITSFITKQGDNYYRSVSPTNAMVSIRGVASGTWSINVTGSAGSAGSASTASLVNGTSGGAIQSWDVRTISPSTMNSYRLGFGFTSWANNNTAPWADYLHLRSYSDGSGGSDNLVTFLKSGFGMRIWQQSFGSGSAYSSYVDVLHSSNYNSYAPTLTGGGASGTWGISISGNAANTSSISNATGGAYTWTATNYFQSNLGPTSGSLATPPLQAYATGGNSAFFSWHRAGNYAVNMGLDSDNVLRIGGWSAAADRWVLDMSGNNTVAGSFRAPIFYDSNDTGYYLDPNGSSVLSTVYIAGTLRNNGAVSDDDSFGLYFDSSASTAYAIYREAGAWSFPYPDLRIAFHTGIKFGANASYKGMNFYTDYDMSSLVMSVNNADYNTGGIYVHGTAYASAYYETSDARVKTILEDNSRVKGIELIKPKLYQKDGKTEFGYIAQDFLDVMPYAVNNDNVDEMYSLVYREVHTAKIACLEDSVEEIKAKILYLENQLKQKQ